MPDDAAKVAVTQKLFGQIVPADLGTHNLEWIAVPGVPLRIRLRDEIREMRERAPAIVGRCVLDKSPAVFSWGLERTDNLTFPMLHFPGDPVQLQEPKFVREGLEGTLEKAVAAAREETIQYLIDAVRILKSFDGENDSWEWTEDDEPTSSQV